MMYLNKVPIIYLSFSCNVKYEFFGYAEAGPKRMKMVGWEVPGVAGGIIVTMLV